MNVLKNIVAMIAKRDGLYVSRPVLNGQRWSEWATRHGVPNPIPADRMHVTVCYSRIDVKTPPLTDTLEIPTRSAGWTGGGAVVMSMGAQGQALVVHWDDDTIYQRHWFLRGHGATSDWSGFRVHMTLSYDAQGFELPDEALADMPDMIVLGPELHEGLDEDAVSDLKKTMIAGEAVQPDAEDTEAAVKALAYVRDASLGDVHQRNALRDLASGHPVLKADLDRLTAATWAPTAFSMGQARSDQVSIVKADDESRIAWGWASMSVDGDDKPVVDHHEEEITTKALESMCHGLIKGSRAGNLNHVGDTCFEIVEAMVMTKERWKALGYDDDREGLLISMHIPDDEHWAMVKTGDWMFSIGGRARIEPLVT